MAGHSAECEDQLCSFGSSLILLVLVTHIQALIHMVHRQLYKVMGF